jgi:uncharacterized protein (TIGR03382 family)
MLLALLASLRLLSPALACSPELPGVAPFVPGDGATGVPVDAILVARLVEVPEPDCAVDVVAPDGEVIGGDVSLGCDGECCVFTPDAPLLPDATYTVAWFGGLDGDLALTADTSFTTGTAATAPVEGPTLAVGFVEREPLYTTCDAGDEWSYPVSLFGTPGRMHYYELAEGGAVVARFQLLAGDSWDRDVKRPPGVLEDDVACFTARVVDAAGRASPWTEPACPAGSGADSGEGCGCAGVDAGPPGMVLALAATLMVGVRRRTGRR